MKEGTIFNPNNLQAQSISPDDVIKYPRREKPYPQRGHPDPGLAEGEESAFHCHFLATLKGEMLSPFGVSVVIEGPSPLTDVAHEIERNG